MTRDNWSRPENLSALRSGLTNAARLEVLQIPNATHFVLLDRPERDRQVFVDRLRVSGAVTAVMLAPHKWVPTYVIAART